MVGFIPLNLRSQEMDKGMPHARAPPPAGRGVAWRGEARRGEAGKRAWCVNFYDSASAGRLLA
jgi:hypothetical protein